MEFCKGGVLSPFLFNVYIDGILRKLGPYGCHINNVSCGSFLYADDLILLAPSITELIRMVNIACNEFQSIGLKINCAKSGCMRIGPKFAVKLTPIMSTFGNIPWVTEAKYLGIKILRGRKFN